MRIHNINVERLEVFANHLAKNQLHIGIDKCEHDAKNEELEAESQHTMTDAVILLWPFGELVHIYPDEWYFNEEDVPVYVKDENDDVTIVSSAMAFFKLSFEIFFQLFVLRQQNLDIPGMKELRGNTTAEDLANNIKAYLLHIKKLKYN